MLPKSRKIFNFPGPAGVGMGMGGASCGSVGVRQIMMNAARFDPNKFVNLSFGNRQSDVKMPPGFVLREQQLVECRQGGSRGSAPRVCQRHLKTLASYDN